MRFDVETIARVCHATNKEYCERLGDFTQRDWVNAPEWQRTSAMKGVQFIIDNPEAGPSSSHESWLKEKAETGWKFGETKNEALKEHPCFIPYSELPFEQRVKDHLFGAVVRSMINEEK